MEKRLIVNEVIELDIVNIDLEGRGLASSLGVQLEVDGAFVGEKVRARVEFLSKGAKVGVARLTEVLRAHPERRKPPCAAHKRTSAGRCAGCPLMELTESEQRKQKAAMLRSLGLEVSEVRAVGPELGYRLSSKRIAFGGPGFFRLGSFARGTHQPCNMQGCLVDHPRIEETASAIAALAVELALPAYDERVEKGSLPYAPGQLRAVWFKTDGAGVLVTLVTVNDEAPTDFAEKVFALPGVVGVTWQQVQSGNDLRGTDKGLLFGSERLEIDGQDYGGSSFLQPNPRVARVIYEQLVRDAEGVLLQGELAWDLYAGTGATTQLLRGSFETVLACESNANAAALLGVSAMTAEEFLRRQIGQKAPSLVVANPPRKGMGSEVCQALASFSPESIHIMSCGPKGLAQDIAVLQQQGYVLEGVDAFDTLPQTPHVELLARLHR